LILIAVQSSFIQAQVLPGFKISGSFVEQQMVIENSPPGTRILINAPLSGPKLARWLKSGKNRYLCTLAYDGKPVLFTDVLKDPVLYKIFSDEDAPLEQVVYINQ
jgi:hypothetical protein